MGKSAEQILISYAEPDNDAPPVCAPEDLAPEARELSFGLYLRRERILRGITREEVIRVTKVSPTYLESLEASRFSDLPPKAFVVGFLRVFCAYAGLDVDDVVNRYLTSLGRQEAYEEREAARRGFFRRHLSALLGLCGAVGLLILMFAPFFRGA